MTHPPSAPGDAIDRLGGGEMADNPTLVIAAAQPLVTLEAALNGAAIRALMRLAHQQVRRRGSGAEPGTPNVQRPRRVALGNAASPAASATDVAS
jgi:hypothetical protein